MHANLLFAFVVYVACTLLLLSFLLTAIVSIGTSAHELTILAETPECTEGERSGVAQQQEQRQEEGTNNAQLLHDGYNEELAVVQPIAAYGRAGLTISFISPAQGSGFNCCVIILIMVRCTKYSLYIKCT